MYKQALIPRNELLSWINSFLSTSYGRLEDASNGAVACQIIDAIYPNSVPMKALDFTASTPYDCQKNYNVLKSVINKLKLPINLNMEALCKQGYKESYEFLSMLKAFFDDNYRGGPYDAVGRRRESKGSKKVTKVIDSVRELTPQVIEHKRVRSQVVERNTYTPVLSYPNEHVHSLVSTPSKKTGENAPRERGEEYHHVMTPLFLNPNKGGYGVDKKQTDHTATMHEMERLKTENEELKGEIQNLQDQFNSFYRVSKMREALLNAERIFYYNKLIEIEQLLFNNESFRQLTETENEIKEILYSKEGLENAEAKPESVNSNDRASLGEMREEVIL